MHVLVLPSRLPIDLRLAFRDLNETDLASLACMSDLSIMLILLQNQGVIPDHMNILAASEAFEHVSDCRFHRESLGLMTF